MILVFIDLILIGYICKYIYFFNYEKKFFHFFYYYFLLPMHMRSIAV